MFNGPFSLENDPFFLFPGVFVKGLGRCATGYLPLKDGKLYQEPAPHPLAGKPAVCS